MAKHKVVITITVPSKKVLARLLAAAEGFFSYFGQDYHARIVD